MSNQPTESNSQNREREEPKEINLPSRLPPSGGNLAYDSVQSALHITAIPCARESLLAGIAAGAGIGVIRGFSLRAPFYSSHIQIFDLFEAPIKAGNWAVATFTLTSIASWHICQSRIRREREQVASVLEQTPRRRAVVKDSEMSVG
ncbi:hypothetical protein Ac2012v2_005814 [Leucoagaricus gongylophorus]